MHNKEVVHAGKKEDTVYNQQKTINLLALLIMTRLVVQIKIPKRNEIFRFRSRTTAALVTTE